MRESTIVAEWKAEGKAESRRVDLLRLIQLRFGTAVPSDLVAAVETQADLDVLSRWFDRAVLAESLDAVRAAIVT